MSEDACVVLIEQLGEVSWDSTCTQYSPEAVSVYATEDFLMSTKFITFLSAIQNTTVMFLRVKVWYVHLLPVRNPAPFSALFSCPRTMPCLFFLTSSPVYLVLCKMFHIFPSISGT